MERIEEAVQAYLQQEAEIPAVCAPARYTGAYPLLSVGIRACGTVLLAGGRQARCDYEVTVTAAGSREREGQTALLDRLLPALLRGIPMTVPAEAAGGRAQQRVLSPRRIETQGDRLTFRLSLCVPVPPKKTGDGGQAGVMARLHLSTP